MAASGARAAGVERGMGLVQKKVNERRKDRA